jgi:hypothetical protein
VSSIPTYPIVPGTALLTANVPQYFFAQDIGVALPSLGKGNEFVSDGLFNVVGTVPGPESNTRQFESDPQDSPSLWVEPLAIEKGGYWHDVAPMPHRRVTSRLVSRARYFVELLAADFPRHG